MKQLALLIITVQISIAAIGQTNDITLLRHIYSGRDQGLDNSMKFISQTVTPVSVAVPLCFIVTGLVEKDNMTLNNGYRSTLALAGAMTISYTLKLSIDRTRPYDKYPDIIPYMDDFTSSLPSGHTTAAFATATTLTMIKPEWYVIIPSYAYAVTVAYSRMHLGMHYPTDILAGALIGSGLFFFVI